VIKSTVRSFLADASHISESDLQAVESAVKGAISRSGISATPETTQQVSRPPSSYSEKPATGTKKKSPLILDPDDPKTNPWTVMDTLKAIEGEESLKNDKVRSAMMMNAGTRRSKHPDTPALPPPLFTNVYDSFVHTV